MKNGLHARWSKREKDIVFEFDRHKWDGHLLHHHLTPLIDELKKRGFDVTTLKFSVKRIVDETENNES